ncbi:hypothetical protein AAC03nite_14980 [Alicyclobacillus acidoterrestris]|nr:hypothetical protein AAC03nite_14980 [Alicyclobacillus acidoterrestris]
MSFHDVALRMADTATSAMSTHGTSFSSIAMREWVFTCRRRLAAGRFVLEAYQKLISPRANGLN